MSEPVRDGAVVVSFAVPDESRSFVAGLRGNQEVRDAHRPSLPGAAGLCNGRPVSVVHTGVGDTADGRERLIRSLDVGQPQPAAVISAGYVGGLHLDLAVGDLLLADNYSTPRLLDTARTALAGEPCHVGSLVTEPGAVESGVRKAALHASTGALAVDMETAWIAGACAERGLPLLSLRVISDAADQDFPVPGHILYNAARQRPRYVALPAWLLSHPGRIGPFVRFVRGLGPARERLTRALQKVVSSL